MIQLGYNKIWKITNPFDFMEMISVQNKTNFFEERVSDYSKAGVGDTEEDRKFELDADF
jgi:ribonucleoside-diphosphate reductase subunit M2